MPKDAEIFTLHRYFIWANKMRTLFNVILKLKKRIRKSQYEIESFMYMSYWYAGLYVVIEGWKELGLADKKIDPMLESPNVKLLRRYRNGVFHFQKKYYDKRFMDFVHYGQDAISWVKILNREFGRYFLEWAAKRKKGKG